MALYIFFQDNEPQAIESKEELMKLLRDDFQTARRSFRRRIYTTDGMSITIILQIEDDLAGVGGCWRNVTRELYGEMEDSLEEAV